MASVVPSNTSRDFDLMDVQTVPDLDCTVDERVNQTVKVYFAGPLFCAQDLAGNAQLAEAIEFISDNKYEVILPQTTEIRDRSPHGVRDQDLKSICEADVVLLNFNGLEIDSGTVAEFIHAKLLDKPTVQVRTDFRKGGDGDAPWNLKLDFYPRNEQVLIDSMSVYKEALEDCKQGSDAQRSSDASNKMVANIAQRITMALDKVLKTKPIMPLHLKGAIQEWARLYPGYKTPSTQSF